MNSEHKKRVSQVIESIRKLSEAQMWQEAASLASTERTRNPKEIFLMALDNRFRSLMDHRLSTTEYNEENKVLFQRDVLIIQQLCAMALRDAERAADMHPPEPPIHTTNADVKHVQQNLPRIRQTIIEMIRKRNYCGAYEYLFSLLAADPLNGTLFELYEAVQTSARLNYKASHFLSAIAQLHAEKQHRTALQLVDEALLLDALNDRYHELRVMLEKEKTALPQETSKAVISQRQSAGTHTAQAR